jgi:hypothetical protein
VVMVALVQLVCMPAAEVYRRAVARQQGQLGLAEV